MAAAKEIWVANRLLFVGGQPFSQKYPDNTLGLLGDLTCTNPKKFIRATSGSALSVRGEFVVAGLHTQVIFLG